MLRDRLVCGINDSRIQRRLLAEPDLKFAKALELAQAMETADQNVQELQKAGPMQVHGFYKKPTSSRSPRPDAKGTTCYRCGGKHASSECRLKNAECHACKKKGHIAKSVGAGPGSHGRGTRRDTPKLSLWKEKKPPRTLRPSHTHCSL